MQRARVLEIAEDLESVLSCDEAIHPGFLDTLAEGYAYDLAESLTPEDDWLPFRRALLEAQAEYFAQCERVRKDNQRHAASRLCAWLLHSQDGDMAQKEDEAYGALTGLLHELDSAPSRCPTPAGPLVPGQQLSRGCVWLDIPEEGCLALEAACVIEGRERVAEVLSKAPEDSCLPAGKRAEVAQVLAHVKVPEGARLVPLRPRPLPAVSVAAFRRRFEALVRADADGTKQAARALRLQMRDYSWVTREQVESLVAELEGREYSFPKQPEPGYWSSDPQLPGYLYSLVPVDDAELWRFQAAFDLSSIKKTTIDRKGEVADRLVVESVERVENAKAWSEYVHRRDRIAAERCQEKDGKVDDIRNVKVDRKIFPGQRLIDDAGVLGDVDAQEVYLFHGTSVQGARSIAKQEFSTDFSSELSLFGPGLYFAESVTKADEYCEEEGPNSLCTILVCRVCLGDHYLVDEEEFDVRRVMRMVTALGRHSVLGDREAARGTFREFITYDGTACYAEYIVRYRRVYGLDAADEAALACARARGLMAREEAWEAMEHVASMVTKRTSIGRGETVDENCLCRCQ